MAKAKRKRPTKAGQPTLRRLSLTIRKIEVVAAFDQWPRGAPEMCILSGVYRVRERKVEYVARGMFRVAMPKLCPAVIAPSPNEMIDGYFELARADRCFVLMIAVEEDSGRDVGTFYQHLPNAEEWQFWSAEEPVPNPNLLADLATLGAFPARTVQLLFRGRPLCEWCEHDDWVGATLFELDVPTTKGILCTARFADASGLNDWTLSMRLRCNYR